MQDESKSKAQLIEELRLLRSQTNVSTDSQAEQLLKQSSAQFYSIIDASPVPFALNDEQQNITYLNPAFIDTFGYDKYDIPTLDHWWPKAYPDENYRKWVAAIWQEHLNAAKQNDAPFEPLNLDITCKDGSVRTVTVGASPLGDTLKGIHVVTLYDITELKQAEGELKEERGFLAALLDNIEEAMVSCDAEGVLVRFNQAARRLHGLPEDPVSPDEWAEHYDLYESDGCTLLCIENIPLYRALQGEYVRNFEMVVAPKNAPPRSLVANAQPLIDSSGRITGAVVSLHDITERKQAEVHMKEALKLAESQKASVMAMLNNMPFIAWLKDKDSRFIAVNERFSKACGAPNAEWLVGKTDRDVWPMELADAYIADDQEVMKIGRPKAVEEFVAGVDGAKWFETFKTPIYDADGLIAGTTGLARDITEQKMLEENFRHTQKMESVGTLVGGVAHEFNNTLAGIEGRLYLAKKHACNNPEVIRQIEKISILSDRAANMIQQLLAFSRKKTVQMEVFDLSSFIKETFNLHKFSIPENIEIDTDFSSYALMVNGDATQVQQILVNLLHNSRDALDGVSKPRISITMELFEADELFMHTHPEQVSKRYAHLRVEDNGCGIPKKDKSQIFDPFFTTKEVGKGTGLGLAMAYGAIQTHHGVIEVDSEEGRGTKVHIYIPISSSVSLDKKKEMSLQTAYGKSECILLVDDEAELRETGKEVLEALGYRVLEAANGAEAMEVYIANEEVIALTILDVVMPKIGGVEAALAIKARNKDAKIIFCTGYDKEDVLDDLELTVALIISKPYNIDNLSYIIKTQLST